MDDYKLDEAYQAIRFERLQNRIATLEAQLAEARGEPDKIVAYLHRCADDVSQETGAHCTIKTTLRNAAKAVAALCAKEPRP